MTMITFDHDVNRFTLRTVGVALDGERVLLQRLASDDFWFLPGGRCELGETASESLQREMLEELGVEATVERLLWVVENFFDLGGRTFHEMGLYWLILLPEAWLAVHRDDPILTEDGGVPILFQWFNRAEISTLSLYPEFLRSALNNLPGSPEHVVHRG